MNTHPKYSPILHLTPKQVYYTVFHLTFASVGYTGENRNFPAVYRNLQDNQIVQVGVKIPILDWGKRRGKVRVAKSNRDVVLSKIRQEQINFNQDIFLLVEHFNNQAQQLDIFLFDNACCIAIN